MTHLLVVGLGGFLGAIARYSLSTYLAARSGSFPLGTLAVNVIGCFAIGVLFAVGTGFHLAYTRRHGEEFFGGAARSAWLTPVRGLVQDGVLPRARSATVLLIVGQGTIAVLILSRGELVAPGLFAGAGFAGGAALVSNRLGALANVGLASAQIVLGVTH